MKQTRHNHWIPQEAARGLPVVAWTKSTSGPSRPETGPAVIKRNPVRNLTALREHYSQPPVEAVPTSITAPIFTDAKPMEVGLVAQHNIEASDMAAKVYATLTGPGLRAVVVEYPALDVKKRQSPYIP